MANYAPENRFENYKIISKENKMKDKRIDINVLGATLSGVPIFLGIAVLIGIFLISPVVSFFIGYFFGWITKIIIGNFIVSAFAAIGITITTNQIPFITGLIGWISVFLPHPSNNNKKD